MPGLVVGEVDDDHLRPEPEQVEPARRALGARREVEQAVADLRDRGAEPARAAGRRQRVGDVVAGQAADRDRDPGDLDDLASRRRRSASTMPAVADEVGPAAALDDGARRSASRRRASVNSATSRPDAAGDRRDERVVGVEDDPAVGLRDPADRRLDLGQLGQGMDALQVEVVGRDVGQDARVVRLVADAAQDDPAPGRLEDGDVDVAAGEDLLRAARARSSRPGSTIRSSTRTPSEVVVPTRRPARSRMWVISRVTVLLPLVPEIDTIGTRRSASRIHVGGVVRGLGDPLRPARSSRSCAPVRLGASRDGETSRSARARAASVSVRARSRAGPREGDDPVARVGRAMDGQPAPALAVVERAAAGPRRRRRRRRSGQSRAGTSAPSRTSACRPGSRWPYQVRRRPTATSSLTTGSSR